jgi:hypothetical protein
MAAKGAPFAFANVPSLKAVPFMVSLQMVAQPYAKWGRRV